MAESPELPMSEQNPTLNNQMASREQGSLLALGFGTSVLMWAIAYIGMAPYGGVGSWRVWGVLALLGLVVIASGFIKSRLTSDGPIGAIKLGLALTGINFLIVASLNGRETTGEALVTGFLWILGFAVAAIACCLIGAGMAGFKNQSPAKSIDWSSKFLMVAAITTLPLIISGGIVTGLEAGMAVPDWLTTFDYPMMFYPMVKMQEDSNVYAEHFHRLWGLLVGLSVIAVVIHLHMVDTRTWIKRLSIVVLMMVIVQGILGGTRVTENNLPLAIMHGVFGQATFATIVCMAAFCSSFWKSPRIDVEIDTSKYDLKLPTALPILFVIQLVLGALYRHLNAEVGVQKMITHSLLGLHVLMACVLTVAVIVVGLKFMVCFHKHRPLARLGYSILMLVGLQVLLGVGAMVAVMFRNGEGEIPLLEVIITTIHQTTGAILLALATLVAIWSRRLVAS
ncbi:MAG: COX15/CtaA family protein [Planctomycetota bacterium]|nr:COX15/CtaA family protein [Planctomycetota bacterium]